jgi:transcriptional regulator with XRE-family HTH domain
MPSERELDPSASPLALLGSELRKYRTAAGLKQSQLAALVNFSQSLVGAVERAERMPSRDFIEKCETALHLTGDLLRLWPLVTREHSPQWFRPWLEIEAEAHTLRTWQPLLVPGLLQTEDYARAVLRGDPLATEAEIEEAVTARMQRQTILSRNRPPMIWAALDEGILHRPIGGTEVLRRQLKHLAEMATRPGVTVQIVPVSAVTFGLLGGFVLAQLHGQVDTVYLETALRGHVTAQPGDVTAISSCYEGIRAEAQPKGLSLEIIRARLAEV